MKKRWVVLLAAGLLLAPAASARAGKAPDGHDWQYYIPEYKLKFLTDLFAMLKKRGIEMKYDPLFYLIHLNWYYSEEELRDANIGDALADIALPLGDVIASD